MENCRKWWNSMKWNWFQLLKLKWLWSKALNGASGRIVAYVGISYDVGYTMQHLVSIDLQTLVINSTS